MESSKQFAIINADKVDNIDFSQVLETSKETLRWNNDRTKTYVKFYEDIPESVRQNCQGIYTQEGITKLLKTEEWVDLSECDGCPCIEYYKSQGMEI